MNGILNIYKEPGYTSHDVVARLRGILHTRKIGHTGTLDPMAEGVLPVCIGAATKLCETFEGADKEYEAVMLLGRTYDTLDVTGVIQEEREVMSTEEEIRDAINSFVGGYDQVPPMYSAKKVNGQKLYDLARSGKVIERKPVFVNIYDIVILSVEIPRVLIRVKCGKGTYIRSLIDDIGKKLGCGAAMEKLTRTRVGEFTADRAYRLSEVEKMMEDETISDVILNIETVFKDLDKVRADAAISRLVRNGNVLSGATVAKLSPDISKRQKNGTRICVYDCDGNFAGVYEYKIASDIYKPYKMFLDQA
ncbi:MAG: tRNA pseudouridine(55) synthase TruB [Lachnospiraceae bacterium]|nr:tRNA pseudouridine(55) synthase TruB [Lachnospiraceae bacterium]